MSVQGGEPTRTPPTAMPVDPILPNHRPACAACEEIGGDYVTRTDTSGGVSRIGRGTDMIDIDWGDLHPSSEEREALESRVRMVVALHREQVSLRRRGSGYEAHVRTALPGRSTVLRLHGESLHDVVDRTAELLTIVARESARQHQEAHAAAG